MKSLILYWSGHGNTLKVAETIQNVLTENNVEVDIMKISPDLNVEIYDYDLVFFGSPSYQWIPPEPVQKYIKNTMNKYREGFRPVGAPKKNRKFGVVFCTFSGAHTGYKEGYTAGKYMAQFLEHMGFFVLDEWYTAGNFYGWEEGSKFGKLGDITDRPNQSDLEIIYKNASELIQGLK